MNETNTPTTEAVLYREHYIPSEASEYLILCTPEEWEAYTPNIKIIDNDSN